MAHSNSSLNTFTNCMSKYNMIYNLHLEPEKPISPHFTFGTMAHDCLYKAGQLRDAYEAGLLQEGNYQTVIPSEVLYSDLKLEFSIENWNRYFTPVIKQTAEYERQLEHELIETQSGQLHKEREIKLQLTPEELFKMGYAGFTRPLVGIIDCLLYTNTHAIILDYKFSTGRKTQDDFDLNSQLPLYALLVSKTYNIPLYNIRYGYVDIPKKAFDKPTLLKNGTLSRAKSQNIPQDKYAEYVKAVHGDDPYYNCAPNGYYYDAWCQYALNKAAYLSIQWLDMDVYKNVVDDLIKTAQMIELLDEKKLPYLRKYDSHSCVGCEYLHICKAYLGV